MGPEQTGSVSAAGTGSEQDLAGWMSPRRGCAQSQTAPSSSGGRSVLAWQNYGWDSRPVQQSGTDASRVCYGCCQLHWGWSVTGESLPTAGGQLGLQTSCVPGNLRSRSQSVMGSWGVHCRWRVVLQGQSLEGEPVTSSCVTAVPTLFLYFRLSKTMMAAGAA